MTKFQRNYRTFHHQSSDPSIRHAILYNYVQKALGAYLNDITNVTVPGGSLSNSFRGASLKKSTNAVENKISLLI